MIFARLRDGWKLCRTSFHVLIAFLVTSMGAAPKPSAQIVIIANANVQADVISIDDLKSVFLGTKTYLKNGNRLTPVFEKEGSAHHVFLREYLGKTESALQIYYRSLVFSGRGSMPITLGSEADVVTFVERTGGAIGYIEAGTLANRVKRLRVR